MGPLEELAQGVECMEIEDPPPVNASVRQPLEHEAQPEASVTRLMNNLSAPQPAPHRDRRLRSPIHLATPCPPINAGSEAQSPVANWFKVGKDTGQFPQESSSLP